MKFKNLYHGWVIAFVGASILLTEALTVQTFGVFVIPLTTQFGWARGALSGAFSVCFVLGGTLGIFAGRLCDRYGPRVLLTVSGLMLGAGLILMSFVSSLWQVYLIWGLLISVGRGCCIIPIVSTVPRWFEEGGGRGTATGIAVAGIGLGGIIWPPVAQWLISSYGWQQAFLTMGLATLAIIIPLAQFMKHSPEWARITACGEAGEVGEVADKPLSSLSDGLSTSGAIRTGRFWVLGLLHFCFMFSVQVMLVHSAPYTEDIGFSAAIAASVLSVIAGASTFSRFFTGIISDKIGGRLTLSACVIAGTLATIWLLFAGKLWMLYIFAVVFGFAWGGMVTVGTLVTAELFGMKSFGVLLGSILLLGTIGGALGGYLAGSIFDVTGSYNLAFLICVVLCAISVIFSLILLRYKVKGGPA